MEDDRLTTDEEPDPLETSGPPAPEDEHPPAGTAPAPPEEPARKPLR